jgi:SAM-dependent methyltransferase
MSDGWDKSSSAWIRAMDDRGDFAREHILDPVMLERATTRNFESALDVGCGEGRFCRLLRANHVPVVGIDPTEALLAQARLLDPMGQYQSARAENLPFAAASFDLVVSYLTLIDIPDFRSGLREMVRVLRPGGTLLIANINSFISSCPNGWIKDQDGRNVHYPVDRYAEEFSEWVEWSGIRILNWHRPFAAYMKELLGHGLSLTFFDEPQPRSGDAERQALHRRAPWFMIMEWRRPTLSA